MPTKDGSHDVAPKFSKEGRDCFVKTMPTMKPVKQHQRTFEIRAPYRKN